MPSATRVLTALLLALLAFVMTPTGRSDSAKKAESKQEALWADLASQEESRASRALLALAADVKGTLAFLKTRLHPVKVDVAQLKKWIGQLDDEEFTTREQATRKLEYLDRFAKPHLQKALEGKPSAETRKRIEALLKRLPVDEKDREKAPNPLAGRNVSVRSINGQVQIVIDGKKLDLAALAKPTPAPPPNAQWVRAARAVALLESIGTAEARALLKALAEGEAGARPTDESKAALERLNKQK
jgi:hypothetical protein